jgi:hypothetical protein
MKFQLYKQVGDGFKSVLQYSFESPLIQDHKLNRRIEACASISIHRAMEENDKCLMG